MSKRFKPDFGYTLQLCALENARFLISVLRGIPAWEQLSALFLDISLDLQKRTSRRIACMSQDTVSLHMTQKKHCFWCTYTNACLISIGPRFFFTYSRALTDPSPFFLFVCVDGGRPQVGYPGEEDIKKYGQHMDAVNINDVALANSVRPYATPRAMLQV